MMQTWGEAGDAVGMGAILEGKGWGATDGAAPSAAPMLIYSTRMPKHLRPWFPAALLGLLLAAYFFVFLRKAAEIGWTEPADWGHILAIAPVTAWWISTLRPALMAQPAKPDWRGFPLLLIGLFAYAAALFPIRNGMLEGAAFVATLVGLAWLLLGTRQLRLLLPPLVFLLFTIRVSDRLWELATARLQDFAASGAAHVLKVCTLAVDFDVNIEGNIIRLFHHGEVHPLNVAEACSGIRSLMAFLALGYLLAWMPQGKLFWQRVGLSLLAAPVAIVVNIGRVTALGLLTLVNPKLAQGDFHILVGLLMLAPAAGMLLGCGWIMDKLVVRVDESPAALGAGATLPPAGRGPDSPQGADTAIAAADGTGPLAPTMIRAFALGALPALLGTTLWLLCLRLPARTGLSTFASIGLCAGLFLILTCAFALFLRAQLSRAARPLMCAFAIALGAVATGLAGQHLAVAFTKAVLVKQPLALRQDLHALPQAFGDWKMEKEEPPESAEVEHALGTKLYLTRWYGNPAGRHARLHLAYYTGGVDTVPHVPDRCFVAAGAMPLEKKTVAIPPRRADAGAAENAPIPATFFAYRDGDNEPAAVVYFFSANGRFLATPDEVRLQGFDLSDRFGYYCKIEVAFPGLHDEPQVLAATGNFVRDALPSILKCLPAWPVPQAR